MASEWQEKNGHRTWYSSLFPAVVRVTAGRIAVSRPASHRARNGQLTEDVGEYRAEYHNF